MQTQFKDSNDNEKSQTNNKKTKCYYIWISKQNSISLNTISKNGTNKMKQKQFPEVKMKC